MARVRQVQSRAGATLDRVLDGHDVRLRHLSFTDYLPGPRGVDTRVPSCRARAPALRLRAEKIIEKIYPRPSSTNNDKIIEKIYPRPSSTNNDRNESPPDDRTTTCVSHHPSSDRPLFPKTNVITLRVAMTNKDSS